MPNYGLVINSRFRPFSYQEMLAPVAQATEAHQSLEESFADLSSRSNIWENMLNEVQDPELYAQYKAYATELENQANVLATQGLNPTSRQAMLNLRSRYQKEITPIEQAFTTRREQAKMQLEASMRDPSLMFSRNAASTRLLDYVNNPELAYETISGNDVTQRVFTQASALSKELLEDRNSLRKVLGGDYYEYVKQRGFTKEAVLAAIMNSPDASPVLQQLVEGAVSASNVEAWNNADATERVRNYARQGLWGAVGTQETQLVNNWRAQENLRHQHSMDEIEERSKPKNNPYLYPYDHNGETYYYNPQIGMWMDKDGNLVQAPEGAPQRVGTQSTGGNTPKKGDLTQVSTMGGMTDAGYELKGIVLKSHGGDGPWETYANGEDISGVSNVSSYFEEHSNLWGLFNHSDVTFSPTASNIGRISLSVLDDDEMQIIRDHVNGGGSVSDFTDFPQLASIDNYIKVKLGFEKGIADDRIRIAVSNTPEDGEANYLVYVKK